MSLFVPIRGVCPAPGAATGVAELPYDVMDRAEARAMAAGRPDSILHVTRPDIDLPPDAEPTDERGYVLAADAFARLRSQGILRRDTTACFYAYRMTAAGQVQTGVVGGADVSAYDTGRIRRHEKTRADKQADRAAHIDTVGAQTGPVFLIHRPSDAIADALQQSTQRPAPTSVEGPGAVRHEIWPITDPVLVAALIDAFEDLPEMYIADGHHRSAAASIVHARRGTATSGQFLAVAFPSDQVHILAYNRVVRAADGTDPDLLLAAIAQRFPAREADGPVPRPTPGRFGLYLAGRWYNLAAPSALRQAPLTADRLDVAVLQEHLLGPVFGIGDPRTDPRIGFVGGIRPLSDLETAVDGGRWTAAITLHPTSVDQLVAVADAGGIMPPKSTWFEPKLLDGLVCHVLDDQ